MDKQNLELIKCKKFNSSYLEAETTPYKLMQSTVALPDFVPEPQTTKPQPTTLSRVNTDLKTLSTESEKSKRHISTFLRFDPPKLPYKFSYHFHNLAVNQKSED